MSHRINKTASPPNPELDKLLKQAKTASDQNQSAQSRADLIGQILKAYPHQSRNYVTGIIDMLDRENAQKKENPEPWEVAEIIANGIRSNKRGSNARIRALAWAANVATSLYPAPDCETSARKNPGCCK